MPLKKNTYRGVLSCQALERAIATRQIYAKGSRVSAAQVQPASLDLRLGKKAYRLLSSFLPGSGSVMDRLHKKDLYETDLVMYEFDITRESVLEKGAVYLIPLIEELDLPRNIRGRANPKSTTGRLDIFARVLTDRNPRFDDIAPGYKGPLFVEVMPRSFTVKVRAGLSLVQLRLIKGKCSFADDELRRLNREERLIYDGERPLGARAVNISNGLFMSVDLGGDATRIIGYKSRKNSHVIDLSRRSYYKIEDFWEPILSNNRGTLILEPEEFYILSSKERIRVPHDYAAEMVAYEAGSGELRTHYAGFFDPGFGYGLEGEVRGTKAVLEVRAHDVPFMITHGQTFCKLVFEKMVDTPEKVYGPKIGSSYQYQGITLSKQFENN